MTVGGYRALLIANSTFPNDAHNLLDLEGPRNDAALLRTALCDDRYGMFPVDAVRLVVERTSSEVRSEAEDFFRSAERGDTLLVYYSGHGVLDVTGNLFLATRDSRTDRLRSSMVSAADLSAMIDESVARTQVIVIDCCHSGGFKGGEVSGALAGAGRFVLTSCRTGELANDAHSLNRASVFTHHLVEALRGGAPDLDGDGLVGVNAVYDYVHERLTAEHRQIPQKRFAGSGDVPMARRPPLRSASPVSASEPASSSGFRPPAEPDTGPGAESPPDDTPAPAEPAARSGSRGAERARSRRQWVGAAIAAAVLGATAVALVLLRGVDSGGDPRLTITPDSGPGGTTIEVTGDGCPDPPEGASGGGVVSGLTDGNDTEAEDDDIPLEPGRSWTGRLTVPHSTPPGSYAVFALCGANGSGGRDDWTYYTYPSAPFEVTGS